MNGFTICALAALALCACSSSDAGETDGGGGIQNPDDTATGTETGGTETGGTGGAGGAAASTSTTGGACVPNDEAQAVCAAVESCEPGTMNDCLGIMLDERCTVPDCADAHDTWTGCVAALASDDGWGECPELPVSCGSARNTYEACLLGGDECGLGADAEALGDAAEACQPGAKAPLLAELEEERCEDLGCADEHDAWIACSRAVADAGNWDTCPAEPSQCGAEQVAWSDCRLGFCGPGAGSEAWCAGLAECDDVDFQECTDQQRRERCSYPEGECREKFDAWLDCAAAVAEAGEWSECPFVPEECDAAFLDYTSSCPADE